MTLVAYHNNQSEKDEVLAQLQNHHDADEIIKGIYWQNGKGCAVGCTIHSGQHAEYEPRFGIPQALARLEDTIFEGLPNEQAKTWPIRFMSAIKPGADLSLVQWQFLHWLMTDDKVNPGINHPLVKDDVVNVASLLAAWAKGDPIDKEAKSASSAAKSAWAAAESAWAAADSAAESAARSAARAADSAARSEWEAARAADSAARAAAWAAAESAAWEAAYVSMSEKLLELLEKE